MADRIPSIKLVLLPKDTNAYGTIFGGAILSHVDLASAVEARKTAAHRYVTRAMREVEFTSLCSLATLSASTPRRFVSAARLLRCGSTGGGGTLERQPDGAPCNGARRGGQGDRSRSRAGSRRQPRSAGPIAPEPMSHQCRSGK